MKQRIVNFLILILSLSIVLCISEWLLRSNGFLVSMPKLEHKNRPVMQEFDATLGWKNKPNNYKFPPYSSDVKEDIVVSFLNDGSRKTQPNNTDQKIGLKNIWFVGGSFIQGQAISDHETMAWKVQQKFENYNVINKGVPAYGTYQALLTIERDTAQLRNTDYVFYGLLDHHAERNIASQNWRDLLSSIDKQDDIGIPYVSLVDEQIVRHDPKTYTRIPYGSSFALTKLIERNVFNYTKKVSKEEKGEILVKLIKEIRAIVESYGATFVILGFNLPENYMNLIHQNQFNLIDCRWDLSDASNAVKGEGHPSGKTNSLWAQKVEQYLQKNR